MRAAWLLLLLAACEPEVDYGTYQCGIERLCPEGQACNGPDNTCVRAVEAKPFECKPDEEREPDDDPAHAFPLPALACVSQPVALHGCLHDQEAGDWFSFEVPMDCTAVLARLKLDYPVAYENVQFEIGDDDGTILEQEADCPPTETDLSALGLTSRCIKRQVTPGATLTVHVTTDFNANCDGDCSFNRYTLTAHLETP